MHGIDQRGYVRPGQGHTPCSIGAYEADGVAPGACGGDCHTSRSVTINELITLVNIALGTTSIAECGSGDANHDNPIAITEVEAQ